MNSRSDTAVILIGHGSRVPLAGANMEKVAARLREVETYAEVATCNMSRMKPFFPETLAEVANTNVSKIVVIPYFLHSGLHLVLDMPEMIKAEAEKYPGIKIVYGHSLGYDDAMVALVNRRIEESSGLPDIREVKLGKRDDYPLAKGEMEFVAMTPEEAKEYTDGHDHTHRH